MTSQSHPYTEYEDGELWKVVSAAIEDLAANGDLEERTGRAYIVGYIVKRVSEHLASVAHLKPRA